MFFKWSCFLPSDVTNSCSSLTTWTVHFLSLCCLWSAPEEAREVGFALWTVMTCASQAVIAGLPALNVYFVPFSPLRTSAEPPLCETHFIWRSSPIPRFIYIACSNLWTVKLLSFISGWGWGERWKAGQWNDEEPRPWGPRSVWHLILSYVGFLTFVEFFLFLSLHFLICKMGIINFTLEKSCGNEINHFKHLPWCPMESKHKMNSSYYYSGAKLIEDPNLFSKWTSGATMTANIYWAYVWSFLFWGLSSSVELMF